LAEAFPYLILDARYERLHDAGVIVSQAVLIAIGVNWDGRRQVMAVELGNRENRSSSRDFLLGLKARGLHSVELVVADDHAGLRAPLRELLAEATYQRYYVHFLRNALDYVPRQVDDDCCRSCAGCTIAVISQKRVEISPPGLPSGRADIPNSPAGSKRTSPRH
jgi:putative transposase